MCCEALQSAVWWDLSYAVRSGSGSFWNCLPARKSSEFNFKILGLKSGPLLSMINLSKGRETQTYEKQMCPHSTVMFMLTGVKLYVV